MRREIDGATRAELTRNIVFMNDENWYGYACQDKVTILNFLSSVDVNSRLCIPMIREFAAEHGERYTVGVIDAGLAPAASKSCSVIGLPSTVVLRRGRILAIRNGRMHDHEMPEFLVQLNVWQQMDLDNSINISG